MAAAAPKKIQLDEDLSDYDEDVCSHDDKGDMSLDDESMGSLREFVVDDDKVASESLLSDDDVEEMDISDCSDSDSGKDEEIPEEPLTPVPVVLGKRQRKPVQPYIPENVTIMMLTQGGKVDLDELASAINDSDDSEELQDNSDDSTYDPENSSESEHSSADEDFE